MINLSVIRSMRRMTQVQLSQKTGITQETISLYENEKQKPLPENLLKIASALECTVEELFTKEG